jgi:hypothetical protein
MHLKFGHNQMFTIILEKYEVTSLIVMHKHIFYLLFGWKKEDISKISKKQQLHTNKHH